MIRFLTLIVAVILAQILVAQNSEFIDPRDSTKYKTVQILEQTWMAENLNFEHQDSYVYENQEIYGHVYGRLYTWEVAQNVCPDGWHLPTDIEWDILIHSIDDPSYSGGKLKTQTHWSHPNKGVFYTVGFNALPGGYYLPEKGFNERQFNAYFWSQTEHNQDSAVALTLKNKSAWANKTFEKKQKAFSVRCIKDLK